MQNAPTSEDRLVPAPISSPAHAVPLGPELPPPGFRPPSIPTLRQCLAAVLRHRWLVLGAAVLGTVGGMLATRLLTPQYAAQVTIWIEASKRENRAPGGPIGSTDVMESEGWLDLVRSYSVLDLVAKSERLYLRVQTPGAAAAFAGLDVEDRFQPGAYELKVDGDGRRYTLASQTGGTVEEGAVGDSIGRTIGLRWQPANGALERGHAYRFELTPVRDAAVWLADALQPVVSGDGRFLRVELKGSDPQSIARVLNATAAQYLAVAAEMKRAKLDQLAAILKEQLDFAARSLQKEEAALEQFEVHTVTLPSERTTSTAAGGASTQDPAFASFFTLSMDREQIRRDRDALQRVLRGPGATSPEAIDALRISPAVARSPALVKTLDEELLKRAELRTLQSQFTDAHPAVRRQESDLETLRGVIVKLARELDKELGARESSLDGMIGSASATLRDIPPRAVEQARLRRRVEIAENLYKNLQQRYEEARLAAVSSIPDVHLQDPATPPYRPTGDRRSLVILAGFLASVTLAVLVSIVLDQADPRLRDPSQVTLEMGLPILGAVPNVRAGRGRIEDEQICDEAFRNVRINLIHAFGVAPPMLATITSPGSGDGKSFVSRHLALSFAELGHPTLLIDADMRRGALHRALSAERTPGLSDYLMGRARIDEIIQPAGEDRRLRFISCGTAQPESPKLLEGPAMSRLLWDLRSRFRVVLVDSPPLGAAVDPLVLGMLTGNMLLVLRNGVSDRELMLSKLSALDRLPVRLLGVVLNGVPRTGGYRYYSYLPNYQPTSASAELSPVDVPAVPQT
ncbi:MAG TPA: GNVR domain-containing protein [Longimicrobiales bacterium]|nr:GNVR domain-containing protein [Longimicrobiales bacterium]